MHKCVHHFNTAAGEDDFNPLHSNNYNLMTLHYIHHYDYKIILYSALKL